MNRTRRIRPIRHLAAIPAGLTGALLAAVAAAPAAFARPAPVTGAPPAPVYLPPLPPGWNKHPPLPAPAHLHAALAASLPGWQITLIAAGAAVLAAVAVLVGRGPRRTPSSSRAQHMTGQLGD